MLWGQSAFYQVRAKYKTAHELAEQLLRLAQRRPDPALLLEAHLEIGSILSDLGELALARTHLEHGSALYNSSQHHALAFSYGSCDPGVYCLSEATAVLWQLGYPDQARKRNHEALTLAQELSHPFSLGYALSYAALLHQSCREGHVVQERAEALIALSTEQGFPIWLAWGTIWRGGALAQQGQGEEGLIQLRQGLVAMQATGAETFRSYLLALFAKAYGLTGQAEAGLRVVVEALAFIERTEERFHEAELHRLKGELTLQATGQRVEAEECFQQAMEVARHQQAKSWELRTATSLARLWQSQGKTIEARDLLAPVYEWFTEGFDTADLQDAKELLVALR